MTSAETIKEITREHLLKGNGVALGQCLTAVGWVGGTVPELIGNGALVELSTADVAGGGIAVGFALAGRRPIYIVRYQGFQWFDAPFVVNYAAKSKDIWGIPCPIFVRSIAMDGAIGPVASGSHHSIFTRMPGIAACAPMTPEEYTKAWKYFMAHDVPVYCSEHRRSFVVDYEMEDMICEKADITLFPISSTRLNAIEAAKKLEEEGIYCNIAHLFWLKPFTVDERMQKALAFSNNKGIVLDGDFENGAMKQIAYDIMQKTNARIDVLGLEERTAGFAPHLDNLPPTPERICKKIKALL
jgi:acetoin:2,6-dichlorophenolindophenol oxidoreductase subunit beta